MERVETEQKPEDKFEEPQEPVDVQLQEEIENEHMPRETLETQDQETAPHTPEIEPGTTENEDTQTQTSMPTEEKEIPTEGTQQKEAELTEH